MTTLQNVCGAIWTVANSLTYLHARPPRVSCPEHGVLQVSLPWAQAGSRFTNLFEALAIDMLLAANVKKAAEILQITWDEA